MVELRYPRFRSRSQGSEVQAKVTDNDIGKVEKENLNRGEGGRRIGRINEGTEVVG